MCSGIAKEPLHKSSVVCNIGPAARDLTRATGHTMSEQRTLGSMAYDTKGKVTRRERFLREMDAVIPWPALLALIHPT